MRRVVWAEPPSRELFFEDEVPRPRICLEVEPAFRVVGVGAAQDETGVVVQAREDARVVVAVGLRKKKRKHIFSDMITFTCAHSITE